MRSWPLAATRRRVLSGLATLLLLSGCDGPARHAALPPPAPFCTRTLGTAECFATPYALPDHPASLGDTPERTPPPEIPLWRRLANDWRMDD